MNLIILFTFLYILFPGENLSLGFLSQNVKQHLVELLRMDTTYECGGDHIPLWHWFSKF